MRPRTAWISLGLSGLLLLSALPAHAQVAALGKGWLLGPIARITSASEEVISGRNSIKGSGGSGQSQSFLISDPYAIPLAPNQSYTISFAYRIITAAPGGFEYGFYSITGVDKARDFGPSALVFGSSGSSGTVTNTFGLHNWPDYQVAFRIGGPGSIVIDDIRVTNTSPGQLVASENAEGPLIVPGPLNYQLTDATAMLAPFEGAFVHGMGVKDLDGDGYPETILTFDNSRDRADSFSPIIIESSSRMRLATNDFFPAGAPTTQSTPMILFADINGDGLEDIVFAEAGLDRPPFTGGRLGIALNVGAGKYRDVSSLIPAEHATDRSYATAVGDVLGDGKVYIVLPDENDGANTALLHWNGNGFEEVRNWIPQSIWKDGPAYLGRQQSWMSLADFDGDGRQDLLVTGQLGNPNFQIVFGGSKGFTANGLVVLADGPFGHVQGGAHPDGTLTTAEVSPVVVADLNNDGLPDIFAINRNITLFTNGRFDVGDSTYLVRLNQGSRRFVDVSPSPYVNLGRVQFQNLMAVDINNDGFPDVVGTYSTDPRPGTESSRFGTTLFLNDGTGAFQLVDGAQFIGVTTTPSNGKKWGLGSFVPTLVTPNRIEGIVYESLGGCGVPSACNASGLNIYKVVANGALGTGPNFVHTAGFNEFYYLNHYPDAAVAVRAGQYKSGLDHYLAVGQALGYRTHAANSPLDGSVGVRSAVVPNRR